MIRKFRGQYTFLSNFFPSPFTQDGIYYATVEHFYQAMKTTDHEKRIETANSITPSIAKRRGRQVLLRPDWDIKKKEIMMLGLMNKFMKHHDLAEKLVQTAPQTLEEGNNWGDTYWGVDLKTGKGRNILGKMLMTLRGLLIEGALQTT